MEFRELVEKRSSVRQFRPDPVDPAHLREMVRLAGLAPSPNNSQPWQFIAITRTDLLREMASAVRRRIDVLLPVPEDTEARRARQRVEWFSTFFADAPAVIAVVLQPYEAVVYRSLAGSTLTPEQVNAMRGQPDVQCIGAAVEHLLLAATDLGYGGCWLSGPLVASDALEPLLGIEAPGKLAALVAIGKAAVLHNQARDRKPVEEILRFLD